MPDETPTPLPVVPCEIFFAGERVLVAATVIPALIGDIPALAVPDALWTDDAFLDALQSRVGEPSERLWRRCLAAIAAELQARANIHQEATP